MSPEHDNPTQPSSSAAATAPAHQQFESDESAVRTESTGESRSTEHNEPGVPEAPSEEKGASSVPPNESNNPLNTRSTSPELHDAAETGESHEGPSQQAHAGEGSSSDSGPSSPGASSRDAHTSAAADAEAEAQAAAEAAGEAQAAAEMSQLIDQYAEAPHAAPEGEIVQGKVVAYTELGVVVDLGTKSEGLIPAQEFLESDGPRPDPGSTVEVQLTGERKEGYAILSFQKVLRKRAWERVEAAYKNKETLTAKIVDRIKGGLVVDIGVRAFLPGSQFDVRPTQDLDHLPGQAIECRVTKLNRKRGNVVVSRRGILEDELLSKRQALMETLVEGQVVTGKVKNVTDYGVFVDLGGVDGLLHITDLSWARVKHPSEVVTPEQDIEVQILKFDKEKGRVSLGRKQLLPDPWATVPQRFPIGTKTVGKVVGLADYGAFIELGNGIEGLVHISEMSWSKRLQHPSKLVKPGDEIEVMVLDLKPDQRRVSLGMKQTQPDPWLDIAERYPVGTIVTGRIRNLTEFGAFIEIEEGFDGLIHVSDISWTGRVKNPAEHFKKGDEVTAKVLKIDAQNRRVSLGVKQVNDIWSVFFEKHAVGSLVRGKITRITTFGAFVELAEGIEGLCHISELEDRRAKNDANATAGRGGTPGAGPKTGGKQFEIGTELDFKIIKVNREQHKIGLSYRAAVKQVERRDMDEYRSSKSSATATIGDAILHAKRSM